MAVVWADLPADLLNLILSKLFGKDRHSFSLVCHDWKTVAQTSLYRYSPCLVNHCPPNLWKFYQYNTFLSLTFPDLQNAEIRCSKHGWLLMSRYDETLFFFDPSNNRKLELPHKSLPRYNSVWFFNPPTSPECVLVGIKTFLDDTNDDPEIFTLQHGKDEWESKEYIIEGKPDDSEFWFNVAAPVLHGGLIYFLDIKGDVAVLDIHKGRVDISFDCLTFQSDTSIVKQYLVEVNGEDELFAVFIFDSEIEVNMFKLSLPEMRWDSVESIGDKVLYLSHASSFGCKAPSESMENAVYFSLFHGDDAVYYSLSDAKYHSLDGSYSSATTYGLKRFDLATWIMPIPVADAAMTLSWR